MFVFVLCVGAVREHFEKFSPMWFVAVHASIPFVMLLRKAVVLPPYAISVTITSAILGQILGSRAERARCSQLQAVAESASMASAPSATRTCVEGSDMSAGETSEHLVKQLRSQCTLTHGGLLPLPPREMELTHVTLA